MNEKRIENEEPQDIVVARAAIDYLEKHGLALTANFSEENPPSKKVKTLLLDVLKQGHRVAGLIHDIQEKLCESYRSALIEMDEPDEVATYLVNMVRQGYMLPTDAVDVYSTWHQILLPDDVLVALARQRLGTWSALGSVMDLLDEAYQKQDISEMLAFVDAHWEEYQDDWKSENGGDDE